MDAVRLTTLCASPIAVARLGLRCAFYVTDPGRWSASSGRSRRLEGVAAALARLDRLAGLEGWSLAADVADAVAVDEWGALAATRAAILLRRAGVHADRFRSMVAARVG